jgi:small subunit ribosomal protein S18e
VLFVLLQSLIADDAFQHILRVLNTNVDGKQKIMFALTAIRGIGRRFSNLACKKAEVDMRKRWALPLLCTAPGLKAV